jgi:phosphate transport system substrate-binding protein
MRAVPIQKDDGTQVLPSNETVVDGTYQPLSRPLFIYVSDKSAQRPEVRALIEYYLTEGPALAADVGFVALPEQSAKVALQHFTDGRMGTVFGGVPEVGVTIDELLEREAK